VKVIFVGAGPGAWDLLTVRARDLIRTCRICIYAGSLVGPEIIDLIPPEAVRFDSSGMTLDQIRDVFIQARDSATDVIRLHSGEPSLYGAIGEQISELKKLGILFEVVPGISAFQAAAAALSVELTMPQVSQTVIISRVAGRTPVPECQELSALAKTRATLCLYLSIDKIDDIVPVLGAEYGAACPIAVVYHASRPDELIIRGTLNTIRAQLQDAGIRKTAIILVGWALGEAAHASRLYDPSFTHEYGRGA
jgi:precorrin-4/cobalt-precorrin-4 C11-methyltransferase